MLGDRPVSDSDSVPTGIALNCSQKCTVSSSGRAGIQLLYLSISLSIFADIVGVKNRCGWLLSEVFYTVINFETNCKIKKQRRQ